MDITIRKVPINGTNRFSACLDDIAATLTAHCGRDYRLMYLDSWAFYDMSSMGDEDPIDEAKWANLNSYYGAALTLRKLPFQETAELLRECRDEGRPLILGMDGYYCEWDPYCGKTHNRHACIAVDMDGDSRTVTVVDPYFNQPKRMVSFDVLERASHYCGELAIGEAPVIEDYRAIFNSAVERAEARDIAGRIEWFTAEFERMDIDALYEDITESMRMLYAYFNQMVLGRLQFSLALEVFEEKCGDGRFQACSAAFRELATHWEVILNLISKALLTESFRAVKKEVVSKIRHAAVEEEAMLRQLKQLRSGLTAAGQQTG